MPPRSRRPSVAAGRSGPGHHGEQGETQCSVGAAARKWPNLRFARTRSARTPGRTTRRPGTSPGTTRPRTSPGTGNPGTTPGTRQPRPPAVTLAPGEAAWGPWDATDDIPPLNRVDFGSLQIPVADGFEIQLNIADDQGPLIAVVRDDSSLQVQAFAAHQERRPLGGRAAGDHDGGEGGQRRRRGGRGPVRPRTARPGAGGAAAGRAPADPFPGRGRAALVPARGDHRASRGRPRGRRRVRGDLRRPGRRPG